MNWRTAGVLILVIASLPVVGLALLSLFSRRPTDLGIAQGRLRPCPNTPNCVCSEAGEDAEHAVEAFRFTGDPASAWARLKAVALSLPRAKLITDGDDYLHLEFTSFLFRFVDDVELRLDRSAGLIQCRSASRVGRSDLGVNRARVSAMRAAYESKARSP